jgi:hypothetical protein
MWELMWITRTKISSKRRLMREFIMEKQRENRINREFDEQLNKSVFYAPKPLCKRNPRPIDSDLVFRAANRQELIDFIRIIYERREVLPDTISDREALYYAGGKVHKPKEVTADA